MWHVKSPSDQSPASPAKKLGDIIDRVWKSASEEPRKRSHVESEAYLQGWADAFKGLGLTISGPSVQKQMNKYYEKFMS